uniref:Selenoprotein S n=1 Tax=Leptobrachium leishanense TaxID=445787 RepID=A0A8C5M4A7_9ANUR
MEQDGRDLGGPAELEQSTFMHLQETVGTVFSNYGWYILLGCVSLLLLKHKLSEHIRQFLGPRRTSRPVQDPEDVVRRQEAMAAARQRMQEELNAQAEIFKERQKQYVPWCSGRDSNLCLNGYRAMMLPLFHSAVTIANSMGSELELEDEKRQRKLEGWRSSKATLQANQTPGPSTSTSSSASKPKTEKKPLRGSGYNPLTGDGGGACAWRPDRRGPSAGG